MNWYKVLDDASQIGEGQVMEANAGGQTIALSKVNGVICALDGTKAGRSEKEISKTATSPVPGTAGSSTPAPARMPTIRQGE